MKKCILSIAAAWICFLSPVSAWAQRPTAPRLFSNKTLAYLRVDDSRELKDKLSATQMGKMASDPQISPILGSFYTTLVGSIQGIQERVGLNLDEILSVPNGELAVALVGTKTEPAVCVLLEAGEEMPALQILLDRARQAAADDGRVIETKDVGKIQLQMLDSRREGEQFGYFIDSGVFVGCSKIDYLEQLALVWTGNGIDHKPLADNRDFTTIMSRCVGTEGERPQVSFFVDPLAIVREVGKESNATIAVLATLKTLGVDGIKAVGGSMILAPSEFDSTIHGHMLLSPNRQGILRVLRPKSGSIEPEAWVSDQVVSYSTMNWDFAKTIKAIEEIVDSFAGEGTFENRIVVEGSKNLGVDLRKDVFAMLDDRLTLVQTIAPPKKINSQSNVYCLHLKDAARVRTEIVPKIFAKLQGSAPMLKSKIVSGDVTVYHLELPENTRREMQNIRVPTPAVCVLGDMLIASDSLAVLEEVITFYSSGDGPLSEAIEFKLVRDRIRAQLKNSEVSIMAYQRPEEAMRLMYELAVDPANIDNLEKMAQNNPVLQALVTSLKSKKLPPFEVIAKYLAPGGAFVVEEETGLHYTGFSLRRE